MNKCINAFCFNTFPDPLIHSLPVSVPGPRLKEVMVVLVPLREAGGGGGIIIRRGEREEEREKCHNKSNVGSLRAVRGRPGP